MPSKWRRYEILLPLQFNDGENIPDEWLGEANAEFVEHFGAASFETQVVQGQWTNAGRVYSDQLCKFVIDVQDISENKKWMKAYRDRWKARLRQIELCLVSFAIRIE
jgi:hypothetical protein